jgi:hypothetical protein
MRKEIGLKKPKTNSLNANRKRLKWKLKKVPEDFEMKLQKLFAESTERMNSKTWQTSWERWPLMMSLSKANLGRN